MNAYYYTRDHLGSVREMLNGSGSIVARYSYDPYGRVTLVSGTNLATKQYAGYYAHQTSGLCLTKYRAYAANTGRWLSQDPLEENGGINLYAYVADDPLLYKDRLGLAPRNSVPPGNRGPTGPSSPKRIGPYPLPPDGLTDPPTGYPSGVAGLAQIVAQLGSNALFNMQIQQALQMCKNQAKATPCNCCIVTIYKIDYAEMEDIPLWDGGYGRVVNESCGKAATDDANYKGASMDPDFTHGHGSQERQVRYYNPW